MAVTAHSLFILSHTQNQSSQLIGTTQSPGTGTFILSGFTVATNVGSMKIYFSEEEKMCRVLGVLCLSNHNVQNPKTWS